MTWQEIAAILTGAGGFVAGIATLLRILLPWLRRVRRGPGAPGPTGTGSAARRILLFSLGGALIAFGTFMVMVVAPSVGCRLYLRSPDGRYQAISLGDGADIHYQVIEISTRRVLLTTRAQYKTPNDVKTGTFSADSQEFAAAYHYGHEGRYTWIGVWSVSSGQMIREEKWSGWRTDICQAVKK